MSSAAPAAAAGAPTSVAATAAAPALAPMSPFLASRPLASAYGALPPTESPIGSHPTADSSAEFAAPPSQAAAVQPPYGVVAQPSGGVAPALYGAPPQSSWPVASYTAPHHHQPYAAPSPHHHGPPPAPIYSALPPQQHYLAQPPQPYAASPRQTYPAPSGLVAAPLHPSYGAAATYGADTLAPGAPGVYSAGAPNLEAAPSMGLYAPPMHAHAAQVTAPSPLYF